VQTDGLAQSSYQFNWMQATGVRDSHIVVAPGNGSVSRQVIIDRDDHNLDIFKVKPVGDHSVQMVPMSVCRPYGTDGTQLQFGYWLVKDGVFGFWPTEVSVGTVIYLEQTLPMVEVPR